MKSLIHPPFSDAYCCSSHWGSKINKVALAYLYPSMSSSIRRICGIPDQIGNFIPVCCGSFPGSPSWTCPKFLHREGSGRQPDQIPKHSERALIKINGASVLLDVKVPNERWTLNVFWPMQWSHSFGHHQESWSHVRAGHQKTVSFTISLQQSATPIPCWRQT